MVRTRTLLLYVQHRQWHVTTAVRVAYVSTAAYIRKMDVLRAHPRVCVQVSCRVLYVQCCLVLRQQQVEKYSNEVSIVSIMRPVVSHPTMCGMKEEFRRPSLIKIPRKKRLKGNNYFQLVRRKKKADRNKKELNGPLPRPTTTYQLLTRLLHQTMVEYVLSTFSIPTLLRR